MRKNDIDQAAAGAARTGHTKILSLLIPHAGPEGKKWAMTSAVHAGHIPCVEVLIKAGVSGADSLGLVRTKAMTILLLQTGLGVSAHGLARIKALL